jgi:hypothetical protein
VDGRQAGASKEPATGVPRKRAKRASRTTSSSDSADDIAAAPLPAQEQAEPRGDVPGPQDDPEPLPGVKIEQHSSSPAGGAWCGLPEADGAASDGSSELTAEWNKFVKILKSSD